MSGRFINLRNRIGFLILGLTNNFAYVIMLSAAHDLLKDERPIAPHNLESSLLSTNTSTLIQSTIQNNTTKPFCNAHSSSTILLADVVPSFAVKLVYPFLLVGIPANYKAIACALLSLAAFLITGLSNGILPLIYIGVICASFSCGVGELTYLSNTPMYGDPAMGGWGIGTGAAGLVGAGLYAVLAQLGLHTRTIMLIMICIPISMMLAFWFVIIENPDWKKEEETRNLNIRSSQRKPGNSQDRDGANYFKTTSSTAAGSTSKINQPVRMYGSHESLDDPSSLGHLVNVQGDRVLQQEPFDFRAKLRFLPRLMKYFLPLVLVYFGEYFINQGLFELIYYPDIRNFLPKDAQYRWFQVFYQIGVFISRSTLEFMPIKSIYIMSILQCINALVFLGHVMEYYHIPGFYYIIALITYEGLLGGFVYVNAFFRIKQEIEPDKVAFSISTATIGDSIGIIAAGLLALPVHDALCQGKTLPIDARR